MSVIPSFLSSAIVIIGFLAWTSEGAKLRFYHGSLNNYTVTSLEDPLKLLPYFDRDLVSVFYIFGFNQTAESPDAVAVVSAYLATNYTNVLLVDWSKEAEIESIGLVLSYFCKAVPQTKKVGERLGKSLFTLMKNGINIDKIHLVGHSLGAHLAGYAGGLFEAYKMPLGRITGLDPAGPYFEEVENQERLNPSRAKTVVVLHTDPKVYGINESVGTVDFWANCGSTVQPGCSANNSSSDSTSEFCSHQRSCYLYAEAIRFPKSSPAAQADNCTSWQEDGCGKFVYLGDALDPSVSGNYFFSTNFESPYSEGQNECTPNDEECVSFEV